MIERNDIIKEIIDKLKEYKKDTKNIDTNSIRISTLLSLLSSLFFISSFKDLIRSFEDLNKNNSVNKEEKYKDLIDLSIILLDELVDKQIETTEKLSSIKKKLIKNIKEELNNITENFNNIYNQETFNNYKNSINSLYIIIDAYNKIIKNKSPKYNTHNKLLLNTTYNIVNLEDFEDREYMSSLFNVFSELVEEYLEDIDELKIEMAV